MPITHENRFKILIDITAFYSSIPYALIVPFYMYRFIQQQNYSYFEFSVKLNVLKDKNDDLRCCVSYRVWTPSGIITAKAVPTSNPAPITVTNFNFSWNAKQSNVQPYYKPFYNINNGHMRYAFIYKVFLILKSSWKRLKGSCCRWCQELALDVIVESDFQMTCTTKHYRHILKV